MKRAFGFKIFYLLVMLVIISIIFGNVVSDASSFNVKDTFTGEIHGNASRSATSIKDVLVTVLTAVRVAGMAIAIIMLIVVGIKIMLASPSEKANVKQYTMNYVIGAFILLGASGIVTIVQKIALDAFKP